MTQPTAYPPPPQQQRPGSIKVLGTLNLVFAGLGALGLVMTYALYFSGMKMGPRNPVVELAHSSPGYMAFIKWSLVAGAFRIVVIGIAGFGLLRMKTWARKLTIAYAFYGIAAAVGTFIATQHYLVGPLSRSSDIGSSAGIVGGYMGAVMGVVYPIILIVFMTRQDVREAFERAAEPPIPAARMQP